MSHLSECLSDEFLAKKIDGGRIKTLTDKLFRITDVRSLPYYEKANAR